MKSPFALLTLGIAFVLVFLFWLYPVQAAPADTVEVRLLTRLYDGSIVSMPTDDSEFYIRCWGISGVLAITPLEVLYRPSDHAWLVDLDPRYDYGLWCQSDGMDWRPALIEDHDGEGSVIILDAIGSQYTVINGDRLGLRMPSMALALCPLQYSLETVSVPIIINVEVFNDPDDGGPRWQWGVQVPWTCELAHVYYGRGR